MQEESKYLDIIFAEMSALKCTHNGCTEGEVGAKFKTPALAPQHALESSDGEIFYVDMDIAKQSVTTKTIA